MPLITPERLNASLSGPKWSDEMWIEAVDVVAEVEAELAAQLAAPISAGPARTENAALTDTGLLVLTAPVHTVLVLDGTAVDEGDPLPTGWYLDAMGEGFLSSTETSLAYSAGYPTLGGYPGYAGRHSGYATRTVAISYLPGWGDRPALRSAILRKIQARWLNRHDDTVTTRDLTAEAPPPLPEEWTDTDIARLHLYRWAGVHR